MAKQPNLFLFPRFRRETKVDWSERVTTALFAALSLTLEQLSLADEYVSLAVESIQQNRAVVDIWVEQIFESKQAAQVKASLNKSEATCIVNEFSHEQTQEGTVAKSTSAAKRAYLQWYTD